MKRRNALWALDANLPFTLHTQNPGEFLLTGDFYSEPGQQVVVGIDERLEETPPGFTRSGAGFDYVYLRGSGQLDRFEIPINTTSNANSIRLFVRRWYTDSKILISIDDVNLDNGVFVMGSCVSRDTFEYGSLPLTGYRARFSFSSLHTPPIHYDDSKILSNPSEFQRRMVKADLAKTGVYLAQASAGETILVDFIDERLPLRRHLSHQFTLSPELTATDLELQGQVVDVFSESYFRQFKIGWEFFTAAVQHKRIVLNRVFWATHSSSGEKLEDQSLIARQNAKLDRLYTIVENCERRSPLFLDYDQALLTADVNHKWGLSPFHFSDAFYKSQLQKLSQVVNSSRR